MRSERFPACARRLAALVAALALALPLRATGLQDGPRPAVGDLAALKAAFLYNFALYTTWPGRPADEFALCAFGRDELGTAFDALTSKQIDGRPVQVRRIGTASEAKQCRVLYVSEAAAASLAQIAQALHAEPVLVVSDAAGSLEQAMIQIEPDGKRLAFSVNVSRLRAAGLDASARLLRLARSVR